jgi:hypothetical protein
VQSGSLNAWTALLIFAMALPGCVAAQQNQQEMMHKTVVALNQSQILVMTGDLSQRHKVLGEIKYSEPFSGEAIETDHVDEQLRHLAIDQYQDRVDAITHLTTGASSDGRAFVVSGQAIEVVGPCTFCRHKQLLTFDEPNPAHREIAAPRFEVGDTWIARLNDTDGTIEVTGVSRSRLSINWFGHRNSYTLDGNLVSGHVGQVIGSFDPDLGTFNFPLWAGKKWSKDWLLKTDAGRIWGNTHGQALDWEQVTVPAGTLNALKLKIEYRTALFDVQMSCWYAPEVNALARCDTTDPDFKSQQLVSYRPASAGASR